MKKIVWLFMAVAIAAVLVGCGGGSGDDEKQTNRTLKAGEYFEFDNGVYSYEVSSDTEKFTYEGRNFTGRFIDVFKKGEYKKSIIWFERDLDTNYNNGARWMVPDYSDYHSNEVVCVIPQGNLKVNDAWYYDDRVVYVKKISYFEADRRKYKFYDVRGRNSSIHYEYSPDLGFFSYYDGKELDAFYTKSAQPTKAKIGKSALVIKR